MGTVTISSSTRTIPYPNHWIAHTTVAVAPAAGEGIVGTPTVEHFNGTTSIPPGAVNMNLITPPSTWKLDSSVFAVKPDQVKVVAVFVDSANVTTTISDVYEMTGP